MSFFLNQPQAAPDFVDVPSVPNTPTSTERSYISQISELQQMVASLQLAVQQMTVEHTEMKQTIDDQQQRLQRRRHPGKKERAMAKKRAIATSTSSNSLPADWEHVSPPSLDADLQDLSKAVAGAVGRASGHGIQEIDAVRPIEEEQQQKAEQRAEEQLQENVRAMQKFPKDQPSRCADAQQCQATEAHGPIENLLSVAAGDAESQLRQEQPQQQGHDRRTNSNRIQCGEAQHEHARCLSGCGPVYRSTYTRFHLGAGWVGENEYRSAAGRTHDATRPPPQRCFNCSGLHWRKDCPWRREGRLLSSGSNMEHAESHALYVLGCTDK